MPILYLVRHGQTDWNGKNKLQGRTDIPLNAGGLAQAHMLAGALNGRDIEAVYSSPLKRALKTAEIIAQSLNVPQMTDAGLIEMSFGDFEGYTSDEVKDMTLKDGMTGAELRRRHKSVDPAYDDLCHPGGETKKQVRARVDFALRAIADKTTNAAVVVMHNAAFRVFLSAYDAAQAEKVLDHHHILQMDYNPGSGFKVMDRLNIA